MKKATATQATANDPKSFLQKYSWALPAVILAIALYWNTFHHGFVLDDQSIVQDRAITSGFSGIPELFAQKTLPNSQTIKPYRPVTAVSFAIDYQFFKNTDVQHAAAAMHRMNVLYYALALLLTFVLLFKLFRDKWATLAVSILFAAHPIHTEVVANIKSRDEILAYVFGLTALICYIKYKETTHNKWLCGSVIAYFLAILSKESAILFVALLPVTDYFLSENKTSLSATFRNMKWFVIPAVLYLVLQRMVTGINLMPEMTALDNMLVGIPDFADNLATRIYISGFYLYKLVFPHPLFYDYSINGIRVKSFADFEVWLSLLAILALIFLAIKGLLQKSRMAFGILFLLVMFALTCNLFIPIGTTFAERLAFTPSLGFVIVVVFSIMALLNRLKAKPVVLLALVLPIAVAYSFKTIDRNENWKSNETLFVHDYGQGSKSIRIQDNYAVYCYEKAKLQTGPARKQLFSTSIAVLDKVTGQYPDFVEAYIHKGAVYLELKDCANALSNFEKAKGMAKYSPVIESNMGLAYINCGKPELALQTFGKLLSNDPNYEDFYLLNIGISHYNLKNMDSATYYFDRLKSAYPSHPQVDAYLKLVAGYKAGNLPAQQTNSSEKTAAATATDAQFNAAYQLYRQGNRNKAEQLLLDFVKTNPDHALSHAVLGLIADERQDFAKAVRFYKKSIALNPGDYRIQYNLGNTYLKMQREAEAVKQFEKCIALAPDYVNPYQSLELYYRSKNDAEKAAYYAQKVKALGSK